MAAPFGPELLGILQGLRRIDRLGNRQMRRPVSEHEGNRLAGAHLEIGHRGHVLAAGLDRRSQHRHVRPANRQQRAIFGSLDPGNIGAESEPDHQLHPQLHPAADAAHQPDDIGGVAARRHEIDQGDGAICRLEARLQDQRIVPVAARGFRDIFRRRDKPSALLGRAEQGCETGIGIERGPAQPVDRSVAPDQGRGFAVANQSIVFDFAGQVVITD